MVDENTRTSSPIHVEVAYAKPDIQVILTVEVPPATSAEQAIQRSEIAQRFPELDRGDLKMGIFGKLCKPAQVLRDGDRVEIYRPLIADPKQVRKERAAKGKQTRKGAKALTK
jgi:putative ubiquitin-RnfH superfamily antitoxin RatB of RatAB toxin-antitoxin module